MNQDGKESPEFTTVESILTNALDRLSSEQDDLDYLIEEDTTISITLKGEQWSGYVDRDIAKFVINAEKALKEEIQERGLETDGLKEKKLIKIKVKQSSTELNFVLAEAIKALKTMDPVQQILVLGSIIVVAGIWKAPQIISKITESKRNQIKADAEREQTEAKERGETERRIAEIEERKQVRIKEVEALNESFQSLRSREMEAPIRTLVGKMEESDRIQITDSEPFTAKEYKQHLTKTKRTKPEKFYIDGPYSILELKTPGDTDWSLGLRWGETHFTAVSNLDQVELDELWKAYRTAQEQGTEVTLDLQITIEANHRGIKSATIVGVKTKRESAITLGEALKKAKTAEHK